MLSARLDLADQLAELFVRIRGLDVEPTIRSRLYRRAIGACEAAKRDSAVAARAIARVHNELDDLETRSDRVNSAATQG